MVGIRPREGVHISVIKKQTRSHVNRPWGGGFAARRLEQVG